MIAHAAGDANAFKIYQEAEHYFNQGDYAKAENLYHKAITLEASDGVYTEEAKQFPVMIYGRNVIQQHSAGKSIEYAPNQRLLEIATVKARTRKTANPPMLVLRMAGFSDDTNDGVLNGGENAQLDIIVENLGKGKADEVYLQLEPSNPDLATLVKQIPIGEVEPNALIVKRITLTADARLDHGEMLVKTLAKERDGFDSKEFLVNINTARKLSPRLNIVEIKLHDQNGDHKIAASEPVTLSPIIHNIGKGAAVDTVVSLNLGASRIFQEVGSNALLLNKIPPGMKAEAKFFLLPSQELSADQTFYLDVIVKNTKEGIEASKRIELHTESDPYGVYAVASPDAILSFNTVKSDVDENIPVSRIKNSDAIAVVIGNKNYEFTNLPDVKYAFNDARAVKQYLVNVLGYSKENIIYLEDATAARFNETFGSESNHVGKLYNFMKPGKSDVFIYYSGHGAPDTSRNSAYFMPVDVDPNYIGASGYSLKTFYKNIAKLPARKVVVVLDTCFSGNSFGGFLLQGVSPARLNIDLLTPDYENVVVFMSAAKDQVSAWYSEQSHGLYTYYFLKGLSGKADTDANGILTSAELGEYVLEKVPYMARRLHGNEQTPVLSLRKNYPIVHYQ